MTSTVTAVNQTQSLAAIRNFVRAAVSCITYARGLCSDNAYEKRPFLGLPLRQLIPSTAESITISDWIEKGAFDALNRNYLKEMALCVYNADCTVLLESYCFSFNYSADGQRAQMSMNASQNVDKAGGGEKMTKRPQNSARHHAGADSVHSTDAAATEAGAEPAALAVPSYRSRRCSKQAVQSMLTAILERLLDVVGSLPPLLASRVLTMRLTYYDAVTPTTYEPPCFAPASNRMHHLYREEVKLHVNIGAMDTSHHFFSVAIRHPLLQQVHAGMSGQRALLGYSAEGGSGDAGNSAPLRSGLESTFSSATTTATGNHPVKYGQHDLQSGRESHGTKAAAADSGTASTRSHAHNMDAAAAEAAGEVENWNANTAAAEIPMAPLSSVRHLVEEGGDGAAPQRALKAREVAYLLLVSFVIAHAPNVRGGRGRLTSAEVEAYRAQSCPVELSAEMTRRMLQQLCREGFLVAGAEASVSEDCHKAAFESRCEATSGPAEWMVPDPPLSILQPLLRLDVLTQLLTYSCHMALQEACVYLERENARSASRVCRRDAAAAAAATTRRRNRSRR